ncbi:hypothetical protein ACFQ0O_09080 [Saccharopolyspora spinosporotrichia]
MPRDGRAGGGRGLSLDVCSSGELATALAAGGRLDGSCCTATPNRTASCARRSPRASGAWCSTRSTRSTGWARRPPAAKTCCVTPGVDGHTHRAVTTGVDDQKFGFPLGRAAEAVERVRRQPRLELVGLHCHIGSQITDVGVYEDAVRRLAAFMTEIALRHGTCLRQLNIGGGHAVQATGGLV